MNAEQIRYAIIARVLRGIERAADRIPYEEVATRHAMYKLLGRLEYAHYEGACCYGLDECVAKLGGVL